MSNVETQWILVRGLARESRHWGDFTKELETALEQAGTHARVNTIDLPGTGRFSEMTSPISISHITEFAREKYLELRQRQREQGEAPARRTFLVALSLGGMVASRWMERWPDDFAGCVLINTSFRTFSPLYRRLSPMSLKHFYGVLRNAGTSLAREAAVLKLVSNRSELRDETAKAWAKIHDTRPVSLENVGRQLLAAARFEPRLENPPLPILILNSLGDRMVHPSCSAEIAKRWRADLRRHPTAGHDLPLDASPWVVQEITDWYKKL